MEFLRQVDNDIIGIMIMLVILFRLRQTNEHPTVHSRLFKYLTLSVLVQLVFELASWAIDGVEGQFALCLEP